MYGLVNQAVEGLVRRNFGDETWFKIKDRAGVEEDLFLSNQGYPDEVTYNLVGAASEVLETPAEDILNAFGEYWVLETATKGYGDLMDAAGDNLADFLTYLPNFHTRVKLIFPDLRPPSFTVTDVAGNRLVLHYFSDREGLQAFVVGLVYGLGKRFGTPAEVRYLQGKAEGLDHDEFEVTW